MTVTHPAMRRGTRLAALLLLTLGLGACQPAERSTLLSIPTGFGALFRGEMPAAGVPSDLAADPTRLKGMSSPIVKAALGDPTFRRRDAKAEIWQYFGEGCVLDLFLYEESGQQKVAHYALRSPNAGASATIEPACYSGLVSGKRGARMS